MTRDEAIAAAKAGALQIQTALAWFESEEPQAALTYIHADLGRIASKAELLLGLEPGTIRPADGGTNKPNP